MILDYSEVKLQKGSFGVNGGNDRDLYFDRRGYCQNCKTVIKTVYNKGLVDTKSIPGTDWHRSESAWVCDHCGWWEHSYHSQLDSNDFSESFKDWEVQINSAILRKFSIGSNQVPIESLETYINKHPDDIINIHQNKMEELVASVFSDYYKCTAKVVGRSSDGGVDIILVNSDKPIIIQVKRRKSLDKSESVAPIRELIGATLLQDSKDCIFVTTGKKFTKKAIETKDLALTKKLVNTFELYNRDEFIDVLQLRKNNSEELYLKYLQIP